MNDAKETPQPSQPLPASGNADPWAEKGSQPRDINKTVGGKLTNWVIDWGIGFFGNATLSVYMTYYLNPKPYIKTFKNGLLNGINNLVKTNDAERQEKISSGIRSGVEICFQFLAGIIATIAMTPLVSRREKIAYGINKMLGRDTDVLPSDQQHKPEPQTVQEQIRQEIDKHVNYKQTAGDLWLTRIPATFAIFLGDQVYNWGNIKLEEKGLPSADTYIFRAGQQIYKTVPETSGKLNHWFEQHEAGMEDIKQNAPAHYRRIEAAETKYGGTTSENLNKDRMATAEGARLFAKEVGWTFAMADTIKRGTQYFQRKRIKKETQKAISTLQKNGLIPQGYRVEINPQGEVVISSPQNPAPASTALTSEQPAAPALTDAAPSPRLDLKEQNWTHDSMQAKNPQLGATIH